MSAVLRISGGQRLCEFQVLKGVAICDHLGLLLLGETVSKIFGESLGIAFDLLVEPLGRYSVKTRKVGIDQHGVSTKKKNGDIFNFGHPELQVLKCVARSI